MLLRCLDYSGNKDLRYGVYFLIHLGSVYIYITYPYHALIQNVLSEGVQILQRFFFVVVVF